MRTIAIIGGGIAGISAALRLADEPDVSVVLVEGETRLGGKIATDRFGDSVLEWGPDGFIAWRPEGLQLCRDLDVATVRSAAGRSSVVRSGALQPIPAGLVGPLPSRLGPALRSPLLSARGKARLLLEALIPRRRTPADESAAAFVRRRGGRELWEHILEPIVTGMYAADGEQLSAQATLPAAVSAERNRGSITRAAISARRRARTGGATRAAAGAPTFVSTPSGLGGLVDGAVAHLGERIRIVTGVRVTELANAATQWRVQGDGLDVRADGVVLAVPAPAASKLLTFDPALAHDLAQIPYANVAVVSFVYPAAAVPDTAGHGYVVPRAEHTPVSACSIASAKFPELADPEHAVVRVFIGRHGDDTALTSDDDQLVALAGSSLRDTLGITQTPLYQRVARIPEALPQYVVGHADWLARVNDAIDCHAGLALAGAAYRGVGIPDCIASGHAAAERVLLHRGLAISSAYD